MAYSNKDKLCFIGLHYDDSRCLTDEISVEFGLLKCIGKRF